MNEKEPIGPETAVFTTGRKPTFREASVLLSIAGISITIDQWTKNIVEVNMPLNSITVPFPAIESFFRFTHVANKGAAFGLFQNGATLFMILAFVVSIGIIYYNFFALEANQRLMRVALGLQLGGAVGNLIDRLRIGHVTDFLDFGPWPVFNVADMSIVAGAIVLGYIVLQEMREEQRQARTAALDRDPISGQ